MKTEIEIWNGSGWNNYDALRQLKSLQIGTRGLATKQGIKKIEVAPRDSERPYGIAARYFDADGELIFTQGFDQNDSAGWIRERIYALLVEGVQHRINIRAAEIARGEFVKRITSWRRNFDAAPRSDTKSANKLRAKFGALRTATGKHSRKECWKITHEVMAGTLSYKDAVAKFDVDTRRATQIWNEANAQRVQ